ncbi:hypothetical protein GRJ2_000452300 [Grus japonensis]|uniref:Uncharacterized protein n=1 Tax=Grus japonensis TaxID=30415 RepID=A0ABC9W3A6_GRUJA
MSQQCTAVTTKANQILGCIHRGITGRDRDMTIPFYTAPGVLCTVLIPFKKDASKLDSVQRRATKMIKGLENLPYEERLKELGLFSLEKRRFRGNLITVFQYLKGGYKENGDSLHKEAHGEDKWQCIRVAPG